MSAFLEILLNIFLIACLGLAIVAVLLALGQILWMVSEVLTEIFRPAWKKAPEPVAAKPIPEPALRTFHEWPSANVSTHELFQACKFFDWLGPDGSAFRMAAALGIPAVECWYILENCRRAGLVETSEDLEEDEFQSQSPDRNPVYTLTSHGELCLAAWRRMIGAQQ